MGRLCSRNWILSRAIIKFGWRHKMCTRQPLGPMKAIMNFFLCLSIWQMLHLHFKHWCMRYYVLIWENFVLVFLDDILIYSRKWEEHPSHVAHVFQSLRKHSLVVNGGKYELGVDKVACLGHVISAAGVSVDEEKISAITSWPSPKNLKELRGFLGLTGYYRWFVRGYA